MASFRAHFSFGIILGVAAVAAAVSFALSDDPGFFTALFIAAVIGGILPDMDSDSGVPFHVTFGTLSTIAGILVFLSAWKDAPDDYQRLILWPAGTAFVAWVIVGSIFKRFTRHRGMAHSLPAALLAGLCSFLVTQKFGFSDTEAFLLSLSLMLGYVGHLVLDELYAAVNFHGVPFVPNQAFGSALKLFSRDTFSNVVVYGLVGFLLLGNWPALSRLMTVFLAAIR